MSVNRGGHIEMKKNMIILLVVMLCFTSGCKGKNQKPDVSQSSLTENVGKTDETGAYVEEEIDMPDIVIRDGAKATRLKMNPEKKIEVLVKQKKEDHSYIFILQKDGTWSELPEGQKIEDNISNYCYDSEGNRYTYFVNRKESDIDVIFYKYSTNGTKEEFVLEDYKDEVLSLDTPKDLRASNNMLLLSTYTNINAYENGKRKYEITSNGSSFALDAKILVASGENNDSMIIYEKESGEVISEVECDSIDEERRYCISSDGSIFMVDRRGLYQYEKSTEDWKLLIDSCSCSFGYPSCNISSIEAVDNKSIYVMCEEDQGVRRLYHYYWDKEASKNTTGELTVMGLYDSPTIRQAIQKYRKDHNIKVNYEIIKDDSMEPSQLVQVINTRILAKDSYDFVVLDELPIQSYIEKGVLENLDSILQDPSAPCHIQENIWKAYQNEQGIYCVPARMKLPLVFGEKKLVESMNDFASWNQIVGNDKSNDIFGKYDVQDFIERYQKYYINDFVDFEHKCVVNDLAEYVVNIHDIYQKSCFEHHDNIQDVVTDEDGYNALDWIMNDEARLGIIESTSMVSCYIPLWIANQNENSIGTIHDMFIPKGMIGMNKESKNKEEAKQLIQYIFSEEVQEVDLDEGFPVNRTALDQYGLKPDDYCIPTEQGDIGQPEIDDMKRILMLCRTVTTPVNTDVVLNQMLEEILSESIQNDQDMDSSVEQLQSKLNRYLQE